MMFSVSSALYDLCKSVMMMIESVA